LPGDLEPPWQATQQLGSAEYQNIVQQETKDGLEELGEERSAVYIRRLNNAQKSENQVSRTNR
jgi:hypothetical protein